MKNTINKIKGNRRILSSLVLALIIGAFFVLCYAAHAAFVAKTWDGGGTTNNWSEAANWTGDTVPGVGDDVTFDGTSVKDATIDIDINVGSIKIDTGYTGAITQSDAAAITVSGCAGRPCYLQHNGTFNGSSNTITLIAAGFGSLTMNGGTFNGGSGDILLGGASTQNPSLTMLGGLFRSTSGNLTTAGSIVSGGTSTFQNNGGTVTLTASGPFQGITGDSNHLSILFNNLNVNLANGASILVGPRVIVAGNLALNDGSLSQNGSVIEARGGFSISPNFDGGVISLEFANGSGPRTFTFSAGLNLPKIVVNDPNVTINTSGPGPVTFPHELILSEGVVDQGDVDLIINAVGIGGGFCYIQNGGTFNGSSNTITLNSNGFGSLRVNGGTFNGGSGDINLVGAPSDNPELSLQGGTFKSTSGNLTVPGLFRFQGVGTSFLHNGGTIKLTAGGQNGFLTTDSDHPTINFNNLNVNAVESVNYNFGARAIVEGTLVLNDGRIGQGVIEARGDFSISANFDGGIGAVEFANGVGPRTFTFATGLSLPMIVVNDPNVTINTSGIGTLAFAHELILRQGIVNQGNVDLLIDSQGFGNTSYQQTGGTFNGSSNTINIHSVGFGAILMDGGSFNGGTGDMFLIGNPGTNPGLVNRGGAFRSTSGNLTLGGNFVLQNPGSSFDPNGGTVTFVSDPLADIAGDHPPIVFNNVNVNLAPGAFIEVLTSTVVNGNLQLNEGSLTAFGPLNANGNVKIGAGFDGTETRLGLGFGGSANQTFTNLGGVNPQGTWTINKPTGIVTAVSSLILQPTQQLNITSGTLFLDNGSNLTAGPITVGGLGKLVADSSQTITLGGNLTNNGSVSLQGGGAGCPESDTILVRSSSPGTQRIWSGFGGFLLADVDIQDQGASSNITVFSGTNSGNNGANFIFNANCPTALGISPLTASVVAGSTGFFNSSGGIGSRQFSLVVNNSGGSISTSGAYTAGVVQHVTDTIRVTDSVGNFADATAFVTGPAAKMAFVQQPTTTGVGQSISPSIQVGIQDQQGFIVPSATNRVVLTILNNPSGGTLSGITARDPVAGVATFDNLSIDQLGPGYTLRAGTNPASIQRPTSDPFNIVAASPAGLVFTTQPQDSITGQAITPAVRVAVVDGFGNTVTNATNPVTIAIANNPGGATLSGTVTVAPINGIATFSDLRLSNPGTGYTFSASSPSLTTAISGSFNIATPFTVTNTNDSGIGSLRQAILNSNSEPGLQTIDFKIAGSAPFNIALQSNLPDITDPAIIDATTQPGFTGSPIVQIDVRGVTVTPVNINPHAFKIRAGNTTVHGFSMFGYHNAANAGSAFFIDTNGGNSIEGNWIGLDASGNAFQSDIGLELLAPNTTIGGSDVSKRNVISGNQRSGINAELQASGTQIKGNYIGTDATGTVAKPNAVAVFAVRNSVIDSNVISGNSSTGLTVGSDNIVTNNLIGLKANGSSSLGNGGPGVLIANGGSRSRISGNRIFANQGLGIQLGDRAGSPVPPLPNDPQDPDIGANGQQNFPVLVSAASFSGSTTVSGSLNSLPSQDYSVELFSSPSCDASGNGEGETFLGSTVVTTDAGGIVGFSVSLPFVVPTGRFITATATDPGGNTSEFSKCSQVAARHSISGRITLGGQPSVGVAVSVTGPGINNSTLTNSNGDYSFTNLPEGQGYIVTPRKSGLRFTPPQAGDNNLITDKTFNFTAAQDRFSISGHIQTNALLSFSSNSNRLQRGSDPIVQAAAPSGPFALGNVTITLGTSTSSAIGVTHSDFAGNYNFPNLLPGDYTLTPSKPNFTFTPASVSFTITTQNAQQDFTGNSPGLDLLTGRITFDTLGSIKAINANGSGLVTVVSVNRFTSFSEPSVTPDGSKVAGVSSLPSNIFTSNSDGTGRLNVRRASGLHSPAWSPNGSKIAFFDSVSQALKKMQANGSGVTTVAANCTNPDWASDNVNIVCIRDRSLITTQSGTVFTSSFQIASPKFSPDGSQIAFSDGRAIELVNPDGTNRKTIVDRESGVDILSLAWSPDGARLAFVKRICGGTGHCTNQLIAIIPVTDPSQQGLLTIDDDFAGTNIDWSESPGVSTPAGPNVTVGTGGANVTFPAVGSSGTTNIVPISPGSAGLLPNGFVVGSQAFDISTTASFTPLITVCFTMPSNTTLAQFNQTFLLHNENGSLVNRTTSRNFPAKQVCGQVASLSPFALAEQVDPSLSSLTGLVLDTNGDPMSEVSVFLSGAEDKTTTTDENGQFEFANLTAGANYDVQPKLPGFLFTEYSLDLIGVGGENSVVFTGTPASFSLSGRVIDQAGNGKDNVSVSLSGSATSTVLSDANGGYAFTDLPTDGSFSINAYNGSNGFAPQELTVGPLLSDVGDLNFVALAPTASGVSIAGQVKTANGLGIRNITLTLTDMRGRMRTTTTSGFGYFSFEAVPAGQAYVLSATSKKYILKNMPRVLSISQDIVGLEITADQ